MMIRYGVWITFVALLLGAGGAWAGGKANHPTTGAQTDVSSNTCVVDSVISSVPATITSTLVGNDCGLRAFADRTYKLHLTQAGQYSLVVSNPPTFVLDTYMAIMTGCCAGDAIVWDDDGAGIPGGPSALYCITLGPGDYYIVIEGKSAAATNAPFTLSISACPNPCEVSFLPVGNTPLGNGNQWRFVQNADASTPQYYGGPFTNPYPCQGDTHTYGFDYLSWFDEDFGWQHVFNATPPDTGAFACIDQAIMLVCSWDVDIAGCTQVPTNLSRCEKDRVYVNGVPAGLGPLGYLLGSNYANSVSGFTVPGTTLLSGPLNVWVDIDENSSGCNWASNIHRSQLQVLYRWNHRPFTPTASVPNCVTETTGLCATLTGPAPADPDGDAVQCHFVWSRFVGQTWIPSGDTTDCVTAGTYHVGDLWKVEIYCTDGCGLESGRYVHEFNIVPSCNDNPPMGWDYGNLGGCYPTGTELTGGPANRIFQQKIAWLGPNITADQQPNIPVDPGDDGVEFLNHTGRHWVPCQTEGVVVTITTGPGYAGQLMYLYAWKDGDTNCHFGDNVDCNGQPISECFIHAKPEVAGPDTIYFTDPGILYSHPYDGIFRFRLLSASMSCDSALTYIDPVLGETEDYRLHDLQLPVQMLSFAAASDGRSISLTWITATEQGSSRFILERRANDTWQRVAVLDAAGSSVTQRTYRYRDENITAGTVYDYRLTIVSAGDEQQVVGTTQIAATEQTGQTVDDYRLYANYPNPFNPNTTISFDLKESGFVRLRVFDVTGRQVAELVNGTMNAGHYSEVFDAKNLPSGLYFYRLETPRFWDMKKMILLK